jgi:AraC-like DNA-binding protein
MTVTIRLADQAPGDRLEYWRTTLCDAFVPLDALPAGDSGEPIDGTLRCGEVGIVQVCEVSGSGQTVQRGRAQIRRGDPEYLKVAVQLAGRGVLSQDGREAVLDPGDFVAYDSSRPFSLGFDDEFRMLVLMCPRAAVTLSPAELAAVTSVRISGGDGLGALVSPFLADLTGRLDDGVARLPPAAEGRLSDAILDMLAASLHDAGTDTGWLSRHGRQDTLLAQIRAHIEANLGRPDLSPDGIAAAHHISTRYLHKLFGRQGETVSGWARSRRLEHCRQDLRDPALAGRSVSAIAARWGLVDASHFSRIFRATYGMSPSEYRLAAAPSSPDGKRRAL